VVGCAVVLTTTTLRLCSVTEAFITSKNTPAVLGTSTDRPSDVPCDVLLESASASDWRSDAVMAHCSAESSTSCELLKHDILNCAIIDPFLHHHNTISAILSPLSALSTIKSPDVCRMPAVMVLCFYRTSTLPVHGAWHDPIKITLQLAMDPRLNLT